MFSLRLPTALRARIEAVRPAGLSITATILVLLDRALRAEEHQRGVTGK